MNFEVNDGYILHYPFKWLNGFEHDEFEGQDDREPDFKFHLRKTIHGDSEIVLSELPNRPFAEQCVYRCWFALMCFSVLHSRPCKAEYALAETEPVEPALKTILGQMFNSDFTEVDSKVLGMIPYVRSSQERVKRLSMTASITLMGDTINVGEELQKWMWHPRYFELVNDSKLRLALDLANLVGFEAPKEARFILIMSALEAMLPEKEHPQFVLDNIKSWQEELKTAKAQLSETHEKESLQLLIDKTSFLNSPSISARLRDFAEAHQPKAKSGDYRKQIRKAYDLRSTLVHQGYCDPDVLTNVFPVVYQLLNRALKAKLGVEETDEVPE